MVRRAQLRPQLNIGLSQRLAMTPSLLQKIELLTLSRLELSELLQTELTENPVLEEGMDADSEAEASADGDGDGDRDSDREEVNGASDDFDYDYFFGEYLNPTPMQREWEDDSDRPSFDLFLASRSSLPDHLNWQLNLCEADERTREIAYYIIGNLNADGYLRVSLPEISEGCEVDLESAQKALDLVQSLDPLGVAARDLQECLLLQIRGVGLQGSLQEKLVEHHLDLVQAKKYKEIAAATGSTIDEVIEALRRLRRFSPRPGQKFSSDEPQYIQPDVYIDNSDNDYKITLNDDGMPKLRLNWAYRKLLKQAGVPKETKSFIKEKVRAALELLKSVDQRQQTIFRVCSAIVNRQTGFLDAGLMQLKPMLIKDIAEELGVHSSTISRVVANKYAHTPQGVIELRKFFTVGLESAEGENVSIVQVKEQIRKIIESEEIKPYSDQVITKLLNKDGIQITRRTVAKYRDQMNIPGSRERKAELR